MTGVAIGGWRADGGGVTPHVGCGGLVSAAHGPERRIEKSVPITVSSSHDERTSRIGCAALCFPLHSADTVSFARRFGRMTPKPTRMVRRNAMPSRPKA